MYVPHERRSLLLSLLERRGYLRTAGVAHELGVTEETVRNDFIALQQQNLLRRVHGGARYVPPTGSDDDAVRMESQFIRLILSHVPENACIYADDTPLLRHALAQLDRGSCSLLTPSLRMADALRAPALTQSITLPGGVLDKQTRLILAEGGALDFMHAHRPDLALLCPAVAASPQSIAYEHALQAEWAHAACQTAKQIVLILRPEITINGAGHRIPCTPHFLIAPSDIPSSFLTAPHELIPVVTIQDIREARQM